MSKYPAEVAGGERPEGHLEKLRKAEVEVVKPWFSPGARVLELGGGNGYQASIIASWGCDVVSLDLPDRSAPQTLYYPVQDYDGLYVPYAEESFDVVFSSNVLEHIKALPLVLAETRRVLSPEGLAIHIVPSSTWRLWTSLSHPIKLFKLLLWRARRSASGAVGVPPAAENSNKTTFFFRLRKILFPGPHGEHPNSLSELYYFSRLRWLALFEENGFKVERVINNGLFYTGNSLLPDIPLKIRRVVAHFLGSSCHIFVMRKSDR